MKFINISLILFIFSFIALSVLIKPTTYIDREDGRSSYEIPAVNLNLPLKDEPIAENTKDESYIQKNEYRNDLTRAWTIKVSTYEDLDDLKRDFRILKKLGYKVYSRYSEENKYSLFIGPTLKREDSLNIMKSLIDSSKFKPEILRYD